MAMLYRTVPKENIFQLNSINQDHNLTSALRTICRPLHISKSPPDKLTTLKRFLILKVRMPQLLSWFGEERFNFSCHIEPSLHFTTHDFFTLRIRELCVWTVFSFFLCPQIWSCNSLSFFLCTFLMLQGRCRERRSNAFNSRRARLGIIYSWFKDSPLSY